MAQPSMTPTDPQQLALLSATLQQQQQQQLQMQQHLQLQQLQLQQQLQYLQQQQLLQQHSVLSPQQQQQQLLQTNPAATLLQMNQTPTADRTLPSMYSSQLMASMTGMVMPPAHMVGGPAGNHLFTLPNSMGGTGVNPMSLATGPVTSPASNLAVNPMLTNPQGANSMPVNPQGTNPMMMTQPLVPNSLWPSSTLGTTFTGFPGLPITTASMVDPRLLNTSAALLPKPPVFASAPAVDMASATMPARSAAPKPALASLEQTAVINGETVVLQPPPGRRQAPDVPEHSLLMVADEREASTGRPHRLVAQVDGRRMHVCSVCKKMFGWSSNLRRHMRVHTGERPYACRVCHTNFTNSSNRNKHERVHELEGTDLSKYPKHEDEDDGADEDSAAAESRSPMAVPSLVAQPAAASMMMPMTSFAASFLGNNPSWPTAAAAAAAAAATAAAASAASTMPPMTLAPQSALHPAAQSAGAQSPPVDEKLESTPDSPVSFDDNQSGRSPKPATGPSRRKGQPQRSASGQSQGRRSAEPELSEGQRKSPVQSTSGLEVKVIVSRATPTASNSSSPVNETVSSSSEVERRSTSELSTDMTTSTMEKFHSHGPQGLNYLVAAANL